MIDERAIALRWEAMRGTLDERGRRRWCAAEARSHGRGGIAAVARVTGVSRRTIDRGLVELEAEQASEQEPLPAGRVRVAGGGRKRLSESDPKVVEDLERLDASRILELDPELILLGTGQRQIFPAAAVRARFMSAGIGFEVMDTGAACRTFNVLVAEQRRAGERGGVVMEGRDIGSVVFPDAHLKIFLTASPETRAERRWREHEQKGDTIDLKKTLDEIRERDRRDKERTTSPLVRAADAVTVDSTAMEPEEVARLVVMLAKDGPSRAITK